MKKIILYLIKMYRTKISPMYPPRCKYIPTCSQYAVEAIEKYGVIKGGLMSIWRILRCNPFSKGGFDPVK
ncbi:MAG: membrane protein insertion efficiency factor YidD [Clostridium sp.]